MGVCYYMNQSVRDDIRWYSKVLTDERGKLYLTLGNGSKLNIILHPFKYAVTKFKMKKLDSIEQKLHDVLLSNDDKRVVDFIIKYPIYGDVSSYKISK